LTLLVDTVLYLSPEAPAGPVSPVDPEPEPPDADPPAKGSKIPRSVYVTGSAPRYIHIAVEVVRGVMLTIY
jgi:hypothetical protein